jgi:PAS domain S-box-containing protein
MRTTILLHVQGRLRHLRLDARKEKTPHSGKARWIVSLSTDARPRTSHSKSENARTDSQFVQETLRLCFKHAPVGIGFLDLNLCCERANPAFCSLMGSPVDDFAGIALADILARQIPQEAALEIERICHETLLSGRAHSLHGWPLRYADSNDPQKVADWEIRRIQTDGLVPVGLLVTVSDVTQQKLVQERLRLLANILEATPDLVSILSPSGTVLYLNRAARSALGMDHEATLQDLHIRQLQPVWASRLLTEEGLPTAIEEGHWEGETAFISAGGKTVPVSQILCAHKNDSGEVEFLSTILRDITEALDIRRQLALAHEDFKRKVEEKSGELEAATSRIREQAREQAEAANIAKNAFLSRISHELRTPLNAILGFAQLLKLESPNESQLESIGHITRAGRHLLSLINEVLDITQVESGRIPLTLEPLELNSFLRNCVEMMRPIASSSGVDMQFIAREKNFHARGDRLRLKQVVLNFLSNAIKYNNEGGMVLVSLRLNPTSARFEVRDTGPGIPLEKRNSLFKPFERLGAEATEIEGTGIGLALCKGLIEAMGGNIGLENPDSGGCVFWVELPLADPSELPSLKEESLPKSLSPAVAKRPALFNKILVLESHDFDLQLLEKLLQKKFPQSEILSAMQGDLGLELAKEHHPDLVLLDIDLPDLSPATFLTRLRTAMGDSLPKIVLLGTEFPNSEMRQIRKDYSVEEVVKPYEPEELTQLLRALYSKKL